MMSGNESVHLPYEKSPVHAYAHQNRVRCLTALAGRALRSVDSPSVLDVGPGRGELMFALKDKLSASVTGMDIDPVCVQFAQKVGAAIVGDLLDWEKLGLNAESFDLVVSSHSLEHMRNPADAVESMRNLSRKYILIMVPNPHNLATVIKVALFRRVGGANMGHYYSWDARHLKRFLETQCGLKIISWGADWVPVLPNGGLRSAVVSARSQKMLRRLEADIAPTIFPFMAQSLAVLCEK